MRSLKAAVYATIVAASLIAVRADDSTPAPDHPNPPKERKHPQLTEEQKATRKEILGKYDANKDGKLDKEERAKISDDDKVKLKKAGLAPGHKAPPKKD